MNLSPDVLACAAIVERADPWRFRGAMAAPIAARRILFPLYAFNAEVARAPWVTQEAMIAEMRLQWWRDVCEEIAEGKSVRRHEVATPLAGVITPEDASLLDALIAARRWDIYREPFEDAAHFAAYMDQTAGHLAWIAARRLGQADEQTVRDTAFAAAIAGWLRAIPELEARGRVPLLDGRPEAVAVLAGEAKTRLKRARARRADVSKASGAALIHMGLAQLILSAAEKDPVAVAEGRLPDPANTASLGFALRGLTGRW